MSRRWLAVMLGVAIGPAALAAAASQAGNPQRGAKLFGNCAACHSLEPGQHLTGPSLAGLWGRKAGTAPGFTRYSEPVRRAGIVWDEQALDAWLRDPQKVIPNNQMPFPGVPADRDRADLIAYLKTASAGAADHAAGQGGGMMGGSRTNLKTVGRERQVTAIRYCGDGYHVTTATGETLIFWEANLRFKTDSSAEGPARGRPAIMPAGMMGDRAFVIFSSPEEISAMIERKC